MGRIAAQLADGPVTGVSVAVEGPGVQPFAEAVALAALAGVLQPSSDVPVNLVNAAVLARERGLRFEERLRPEPEDFAAALEVAVEAAGGTLTLRGAVLGRGDGRLVGLDEFRFEVRPDGHLLFYRNQDRPGIVAAVGARLAEAGVNIAGLALGREAPGGTALTVLTTDEPLTPGVLEAVASIDGVRDVRAVTA
jgi:D-3-phosphoglycerate dehydrogenase